MTTKKVRKTETPKKLVLVDDSVEMLEVMELWYGLQPGVRVTGKARTISEALDVLASTEFDLVSLDINLSGVASFPLCVEIRRKYPSAFIVMCSVEADDVLKDQAFACGANEFISKPIQDVDIQRVLAACDRFCTQTSSTTARSVE